MIYKVRGIINGVAEVARSQVRISAKAICIVKSGGLQTVDYGQNPVFCRLDTQY